MTCCGAGYASLKKLMRTATSMDFGVSFSGFDRLLFVCYGLFSVGWTYFAMRHSSIPMKIDSIAIGTICMLSLFLTYRMMVPFVLRITHADMLRVCRPFYVWLSCCVLVVCTSSSFLELLSDRSGALFQVSLTVLSAGLAIEHFRKGQMRYLFLSAGAAGVVVGLTAFGICASALLLAILLLVRRMLLLELENGEGSAEIEPKWILARLISRSSLSGVRFVMVVCFLTGAAAAIFGGMLASEKGIRYLVDSFAREWLCGLSIGGVEVFVVLGVVPLLFVLSRVREATDTLRLFGFVEQVKYFMVVCGVGAFLFFGDVILRKMHVSVVADARYWVLGLAAGGFSFLVSAMVIFIDIRCRLAKIDRKMRFGRKDSVLRFSQLVLLIVPVVLVGVVVFLRARSAM